MIDLLRLGFDAGISTVQSSMESTGSEPIMYVTRGPS